MSVVVTTPSARTLGVAMIVLAGRSTADVRDAAGELGWAAAWTKD
jgi:hypothetical protein